MSKTLELAKISKKYAEALFKSEVKDLKKTLEELYIVAEVIKLNPELNSLIENPRITLKDKEEFIKKIFSDKVSEPVFNLLLILLQKRRFQVADKLARDYKILYLESQNTETAEIISAKTLKEEQIKQIKQELESILNKKLEIESTIDESVIAGVKVNIGEHQVLDATVKSKLNQMKKLLTA